MNAATAIANVRVFDGERLAEPATVVVRDALVSARTQTGGAGDAEVVDGRGGTLLPGLIDTHVHVDKLAQLEVSASWGVTTMLDMGNKDLAKVEFDKASSLHRATDNALLDRMNPGHAKAPAPQK